MEVERVVAVGRAEVGTAEHRARGADGLAQVGERLLRLARAGGSGVSGVSGCSTGGCTEGSSAGFFPPQAVRVSSSNALSSAQRIRFMGDVFLSGIQNFPPECEKPPELTVVPPEKLGPLSWSSDSVLDGRAHLGGVGEAVLARGDLGAAGDGVARGLGRAAARS